MSGFSFGSPAATTTGFSLSTFATPQASTAASNQNQMSFGAASTGFSFGTTAAVAASKPISFGTPAQTQAAPTIGLLQTPALTTAASSNTLSFGFGQSSTAVATNVVAPLQQQPQQQQQQQPSTGFSFGTNTSTPTAAAVPSLISSAATNVPVAATTTTTGGLGGFSFGTPAATAVTSTAPTTSAPSFNFGGGLTSTTSSSTTVAPLNLATNTVVSNPPAFGTNTSTLFGTAAATTTTSNIQIQQQVPTTSSVSFVGLGGIDMSATQQKIPEGKIEATKVKETTVPVQIVQSVEDFKTYVKNQKNISSEIARSSDRKLKTVTDEIQRMNCVLQEASNNIDNNRSAIKHLRNETAKVIENADMAQRTHETPSGLQFENIMPQIYFKDLIQKYETDLLNLKHQVELTEKHLQSLANPQNFTAQDLKKGLQQIHESFIALAGRLQEAHSKVETQKSQYLELRKFLLRDTKNVFEEVDQSENKTSVSRIQYGPNTFNSSQLGFPNMVSFQQRGGSQQNQQQQQQQTSFNLQPQQQQQQQQPQQNSSNLFGQPSAFNFNFNK